jgi:hypothetical protein
VNPLTHFLGAWCLANSVEVEARDRALITLAGILPDFDGLGAVVDLTTRFTASPTHLYSDYHHILGHCLLACLAFSTLAGLIARRPWLTGLVFALSYHLHLLCDILGSRGADGYQWPIPYLSPFTQKVQLAWSGQWLLASWQNTVVTLVLIAITLLLARNRGFSFLEILWPRGDLELVQALRQRFPQPSHSKTESIQP